MGGPVDEVANISACAELADEVCGLVLGGAAKLGDHGLEGVGFGLDFAQAALETILAADGAVELVVTLLVQTQASVASRTGSVALRTGGV